jgi:membrane protease YdiL (CAAX protease family)
MAQIDLIKKLIFISDKRLEVGSIPWKVALAYLLALIVAETLTTYFAPLAGMIIYGFILIALSLQASLGFKKRGKPFLVSLAIVPLIRILNLTLPLAQFETIYWYPLIGIPLFGAVIFGARVTRLNSRAIGFRLTKQDVPVQLLIGLTGIGIGYIEYLILRPSPYISDLSWIKFWMPALILLVFTGFLDEIIFRGLLQTSATRELGRLGILYVALVYAVLYIGSQSTLNILFVFSIAILFGVLAFHTGSLIGISLSHGLANITLYLVLPFLIAGTTAGVPNAIDIQSLLLASPTGIIQPNITPNQSRSATPSPTLFLEMRYTSTILPTKMPIKHSELVPTQALTPVSSFLVTTPVPPTHTPRATPTQAPIQKLFETPIPFPTDRD